MKHSCNITEIVSREIVTRLERYQAILQQWNSTINLIGKGEDVWARHILDCAQIFSLIPNREAPLADLGSGAGLPGLVLAIMGAGDVHLVESDARKVAFLHEAARVTETPVTIHHARIETMAGQGKLATKFATKFATVTARALAPLCDLFDYAHPLLDKNATCIFPKGENYSIEIEEARKHWQFQCSETESQTRVGSVVLSITDLSRR